MYETFDPDRYRRRTPATWHSLVELPRLLVEVSSLAYAWHWLRLAPRGDGHPVLILPGFTVGDESTVPLRRFLRELGYDPLPWQLGRNTGRFELQQQLLDGFASLVHEYDTPISIIGQSLGGVYARELAGRFPDHVRQVITLGSPLAAAGPESANPLVSRLFQYMSRMTQAEVRERAEGLAGDSPVPTTAIYSRTDGVVYWAACLAGRGRQTENIEVHGSHSGMAVNPLVLHALADRLAQPLGGWQPFDRSRGWRALVYPAPVATTAVSAGAPCAS